MVKIALLCLALAAVAAAQVPLGDRFVITFGSFTKYPLTASDAVKQGWVRWNVSSTIYAPLCGDFDGARYILNGDSTSLPIYGKDGSLIGYSISLNNWRPSLSNGKYWEPFKDGSHVITTYFVDPKLACAADPHPAPGDVTGNGIWLKVSVPGQPMNFYSLPMNQSAAVADGWTVGRCFASMGLHIWKDVTPQLKCEDFFPIFLLQNGGRINAFGFVVVDGSGAIPGPRWEHPGWDKFPFFIDPNQLPLCMKTNPFNSQHLYFTRPLFNFC